MNERQASVLHAEIDRLAARVRDVEDFQRILSGEDRIFYDASGRFDITVDNLTVDNELVLDKMQLGDPTYPSVGDVFNNTLSSGVSSGGVVTDNADGTVAVSAGSGYIRANASDISQLLAFDFPAAPTLGLTVDALNYVYVDYNAGLPLVKATADISSLDHTSQFVIALVWGEASYAHIASSGQKLNNFIHRLYFHSWEHDGIERASGIVTSETGERYLDITAGVLYWALERMTTAAFDSSGADTFDASYRDSPSGWIEISGQSQINNTQYDDGSGSLATLTANRYGVHWIYMTIDGDVYSVFGRGDYILAQAEAATAPTDIPPELAAIGVFIAKVTVQKSAANFKSILIPWTANIGLSGASDHGALAGLADDDHTQYLLADGSRELTDDLAVTATKTIDGIDVGVAVPLNTTHRGSDGKDHSDVVLNNAARLAQFVVIAAIGDLDNERVLTAGSGITVTDNGAGGTVVIAASGGGGTSILEVQVFS